MLEGFDKRVESFEKSDVNNPRNYRSNEENHFQDCNENCVFRIQSIRIEGELVEVETGLGRLQLDYYLKVRVVYLRIHNEFVGVAVNLILLADHLNT